ncbi:hypothetical protein CR513_20519, partial [Mucuna pruriens]
MEAQERIKMEEQHQEGHEGNKRQNAIGEEEKEKKKSFIKKKKSTMATCEDHDLSSLEDEDEEVNLCLMANTRSEDEDDEEVNLNNLEHLKIAKFINGTRNLNKLLKYSKSPHDKFGLGFEKENKIKEKSNIHCSNYRKFGCKSYDCRVLKRTIQIFND